MNRNKLVCGVFLLATLFVASASAQLSTGSIAGTVLDPSGLAVVGGNVTVVNQATNREYKIRTNESGAFTVPSLTIGMYRIAVEAAGFRKSIVENVKVETGVQTSAPPIKLELGKLGETITVESNTTLVQTTNAEIKDTVDAKQIESLPLLNRNPLNLLGLQAGVNTLGRTNTVINGQRPSLSNLTLDGINIQDNFIRSNSLDFTPNLPLLSQVAEFTVATSNSGAETGLGASQVSLTTPSGTNDWHLDGFWNHRNNALAANAWFSNRLGRNASGAPVSPKPKLILNQYGGSVGGPIFKNKLFVYGYYEAFRQRQEQLQNHTVLTDLARTGMFTYVPTCTTACPAGVTAGQPRTVNILTQRLNAAGGLEGPFTIDPAVAAFLTQVPNQSNLNNFLVGDSTSTVLRNTGGFQFNKGNNRTRDNYGFKIDWNATKNHTFYGTWAWNRDIVDRPDIDGSYTTAPLVQNNDNKKLLSTTWRWTPSGSFTNELVGGFNLAPGTFANSTGFGQNPIFGGFIFTNPVVTFRDQGRFTDTYALQDNASWIKGRHYFKFGYSSQLIRVEAFNFAGANPTFNTGFATSNAQGAASTDRTPGSATTCTSSGADPSCIFQGGVSSANLATANALLSTLAGFVANGSQTFQVSSQTSGFIPFGEDRDRLSLDTHALYASDGWRIRPRLTINYGVRWEYVGRFDHRDGLFLLPEIQAGDTATNTILGDPTLNFAGGPSGRSLYDADFNNFSPNIGLAWDPWGDGKTSVRAGFSIHFVNDEAIRSADNAAGANQGLVATVAPLAPAFANVTISGALPTFATPTVVVPRLASDNNTQFGGGAPQTIFTINPDIRTPYVQEWNVSIQREIGWNTIVDLRYIGNKGTKLYRGIDFNQVTISPGFLTDFQIARAELINTGSITCTGCTVFPNLAGGGLLTNTTIVNLISTGQVGDLAFIYHSNLLAGTVQLVPNPVALVADLLTNSGDATYNAGVVEVRRRFAKGLGIQANYTYGKVLSDVGGVGGIGQTRFDPYLDNNTGRRDRARAIFDVTHQFKANFVYDLPAGRGHWFTLSNPVVEKFLSGWTMSSVFNWQSGNPITISSGRGTLNRSGRCNGRCTADTNLSPGELQNLIGVFPSPAGIFIISPSAINPSGTNAGRGVGNEQVACNFSSFAGQAFCNPAPGTFGNLQHLAFDGPSQFAWDFSVIKQTPITERLKFEYRAEFFNVLNHPVFFATDQSINSAQFGQFTSVAVTARRIQMSLRLVW